MSLRIGVLGASRIAESAIVAPAQELGHRLVAMAARDPQRARVFAEKHGVERVVPSYGLHILRRFGAPSIVRATAGPREPGVPDVDAWCDVEVGFASGATGLSTNSMVADEYSFTLQIIGTRGDVLVHNFIKPHEGDRFTLRTEAGATVEHLGRRASYAYQLEAFAAHVQHGAPLLLDTADAVANMALIDDAYRAAGMSPRSASRP